MSECLAVGSVMLGGGDVAVHGRHIDTDGQACCREDGDEQAGDHEFGGRWPDGTSLTDPRRTIPSSSHWVSVASRHRLCSGISSPASRAWTFIWEVSCSRGTAVHNTTTFLSRRVRRRRRSRGGDGSPTVGLLV